MRGRREIAMLCAQREALRPGLSSTGASKFTRHAGKADSMRFLQRNESRGGGEATATAKPLFVAGASRTGTTALCRYLNEHPEVCVLTERYKQIAGSVRPGHFSFERIRDPSRRGKETNLLPQKTEGVLEEKDEANLWRIGDKAYVYSLVFNKLRKNNPGLALFVTLRDPVAVATSYVEMKLGTDTRNPVRKSIRMQNRVLRNARKFTRKYPDVPVVIVEYEVFFAEGGPEQYAALFSRATGLDFSGLVEEWERKNRTFAARYDKIISKRRSSLEGERELPDEEKRRVREGVKEEVYAWARHYAKEQRESAARKR